MHSSLKIVDNFKAYYKDLHKADLSKLNSFYDETIVFKDPIHEVQGLIKLEDYMAALCADLTACRFEYLSELVSEDAAFIKWDMHFQHAGLGDRLISVRGASHLLLGNKIEYHEDIYDMGAMIYEHVPVLGLVTRWLKKRLARK